MTPAVHTMTPAFEQPWASFCAACSGGGTPPQWTEADPDDPSSWHSPSDAAGGLVLWDAHGRPERAEPVTDDLTTVSDMALQDIADAGLSSDVLPGVVRATYASSGGRMVALVEQDDGCWWVAVMRSDGPPRMGASERQMASVASGPTILLKEDGN